MRLIDADALILAAQQDGAYGYVSAEEIANAPTIDAEPVRHGKWERNSARISGWVKCSECGNMEPPLCASSFCEHCGAKMDEAEP